MNDLLDIPGPMRRRKGAGVKHLMRCCRMHGTARMRQVLGRFFALRGRRYRYYDRTLDSTQPDPMLELSRTDRGTAVVLTRASRGVRPWILQATAGLCSEAKKRIATEITAHCQDGVSALEAAGVSRETAKAQVLEGLGDPVKANAAFHKTYLTPHQERYMARIMRPGQTQYQTLYTAIMCFCAGAVLQSFLNLGWAFGWDEAGICGFLYWMVSLTQLIGARLGRHNDRNEQRYFARIRRPLESKTTWVMFILPVCLYALMETQTHPRNSLVFAIFNIVPFLFGALHRAVIRDIITLLRNAPRARQFMMFGYSGALFALAFVAFRLFKRINALDYPEVLNQGPHHDASLPPLLWTSIAIIPGFLWFGGHALVGASVVGKATPVETTRLADGVLRVKGRDPGSRAPGNPAR